MQFSKPPLYQNQYQYRAGNMPKKRKWSIWRIVKKALHRACLFIGAATLISIVISSIFSSFFLSGGPVEPLGQDNVLYLVLEGDFPETQPDASFINPFEPPSSRFGEVLSAIDRAAKDDRVKEVLIAVRGGGLSMAHAQEIRQALATFKAAGKKIRAYSTSYGDGGNGMANYYVAAIADEIIMQPVGTLAIPGFSAELPFAKDGLAKIGVEAQFVKRKEYKSAAAPFTQSQIDPATQEMMQSIITGLGDQFVSDVAKDRNISHKDLKNAINSGLLLDQEALDRGLIDALAYGDQVVEQIKQDLTGDPDSSDVSFLSPISYLAHLKNEKSLHATDSSHKLASHHERKDKAVVALVHVNGAIVAREKAFGSAQSQSLNGNVSPAFAPLGGGDNVAAANVISRAIFDVADRSDVKAIIIRIDSPGGSPTASETIRRAILQAKEAGKKIIVSMGPTAASGGYWIAPDADMILAMPSTLTGSIGVLGGKMVLDGLWDHIGVNWHRISYGENAGIWSANQKFNTSELARFNAMMDNIYDEFVARVAEGRGMSVKEVDKIARGRAWTGEQALKIGLVDKIGGLHDAMDETAVLLGLENGRESLIIREYPKEKTFAQRILDLFEQQVSLGQFFIQMQGKIAALIQISGAQQILQGQTYLDNPQGYATHSLLPVQ